MARVAVPVRVLLAAAAVSAAVVGAAQPAGGPTAPSVNGGTAARTPGASDAATPFATAPVRAGGRPPAAATAGAAQARRAQAVRSAVATVLRGRPGAVELAITDVADGQVVLVGAGRSVRTASIVKLLVLRAALDRGPLTGAERVLADRMITRSDNAATTQLWRGVGRDRAVARAAAALGMKATTRIPVLFQPWDGWQTTAADQARLLRAIATGRDAASRYTRALLAQVVPDQAWGVGALAAATGVKNGWVPVDGRWVVNSDGCVDRNRVPLCVAVLSTGSGTLTEGIDTVERAAAAAVRAWAAAGA